MSTRRRANDRPGTNGRRARPRRRRRRRARETRCRLRRDPRRARRDRDVRRRRPERSATSNRRRRLANVEGRNRRRPSPVGFPVVPGMRSESASASPSPSPSRNLSPTASLNRGGANRRHRVPRAAADEGASSAHRKTNIDPSPPRIEPQTPRTRRTIVPGSVRPCTPPDFRGGVTVATPPETRRVESRVSGGFCSGGGPQRRRAEAPTTTSGGACPCRLCWRRRAGRRGPRREARWRGESERCPREVVSRVSRRASTSDGRVRAHPSFGWGRAWIRRSRSRRASARSSVDGAGRSAGAAGPRGDVWPRGGWPGSASPRRDARRARKRAPWKSMWRFTASARLPLADWSARRPALPGARHRPELQHVGVRKRRRRRRPLAAASALRRHRRRAPSRLPPEGWGAIGVPTRPRGAP